MPVTEIATLRLVSPRTWDSSDVQSFFKAFSDAQIEWMVSPSGYFEDASDPSIVYVVKGWGSVVAHHEWIASTLNQELLKKVKGLLEVEGLVHAELECKVEKSSMVLWTRWQVAPGEITATLEDAGCAVEEEGTVWSLKGYARAEDIEANTEGKKVVLMKKLSLSS